MKYGERLEFQLWSLPKKDNPVYLVFPASELYTTLEADLTLFDMWGETTKEKMCDLICALEGRLVRGVPSLVETKMLIERLERLRAEPCGNTFERVQLTITRVMLKVRATGKWYTIHLETEDSELW